MGIGEGIAIASVCSVVIAAICKFVPTKTIPTNGYITRREFEVFVKQIFDTLKDVRHGQDEMFNRLRGVEIRIAEVFGLKRDKP